MAKYLNKNVKYYENKGYNDQFVDVMNGEGGGGSGGTVDYNELNNKPSISGIELKGNKFPSDLGIYSKTDVDAIIEQKLSSIYEFKGSVTTVADLPATASTGDSYNITSENKSYSWNGETWCPIGTAVVMSEYYTISQADERFNSLNTKVDDVEEKKVDANQGLSNVNKLFVVNNEGKVTPTDDYDCGGF